MIIVHVTLWCNESDRDETIAAMKELQRATREHDPGCQVYTFSADLDEDTVFYCTEEWRSGADLAAHLASDHMAHAETILDRTLRCKSAIAVFNGDPTDIPDH